MTVRLLTNFLSILKNVEKETYHPDGNDFNRQHLNKFISTIDEGLNDFPGFVPSKWWSHVSQTVKINHKLDLPETRVSRQQLMELSRNNNVDDLHFSVCVLAWGGMNRKHGALAFRNFRYWQPIVASLRHDQMSWDEAYSEFSELRSQDLLPGIGPAYFTKLIFFGCLGRGGYIMDQWTARSINLLTQRPVVDLKWTTYKGRTSAQVSDDNIINNFRDFCTLVDRLSIIVGRGMSGADIEAALFSEGRGNGTWRRYVKAVTTDIARDENLQ